MLTSQICIGIMKDEIEVKEEILKAAKGLIQQYGMNKPTMQDVAKAAGKGKSTLYYYFKNKEEIFDAVIKVEMNEFFLQVKSAVDREDDFEAKLKTYLITKVTLLKQKLKQYRVIIENESHHFDMQHYFSLNMIETNTREQSLIHSIFSNGTDAEKLHKSVLQGKNGEVLVEIFLTFIRGIEMEVFINKGFKSLNEKAEMMVDILTKGLK